MVARSSPIELIREREKHCELRRRNQVFSPAGDECLQVTGVPASFPGVLGNISMLREYETYSQRS